MAEKILMGEFKALSKEPWTNIELVNENMFEWTVALIPLDSESPHRGGYFKAKMTFPRNYPFSPPDFKFLRPLYHPNVYADGRLCISILHPPGEDEMSGELASERWSPIQRVESVLISILSLLDDPEVSSPANVDAGVMVRMNPDAYKSKVRQDVEDSKQDIPAGFEMPTQQTAYRRESTVPVEDPFSWEDSDIEEDFGSDSDVEMASDDDDDGDDDAATSSDSDA